MQYSYTPHARGETFISHTVRSCVRPSVGYDSSLRGANTIQYVSSTASFAFCNLGLPSQGSSILRKTCHALNTATLQHDNSVHANTATM